MKEGRNGRNPMAFERELYFYLDAYVDLEGIALDVGNNNVCVVFIYSRLGGVIRFGL